MGLFGALKKLAGGVIKTGLSFATHGVSDKVLGALKGMGKKRATTVAKPTLWTEQETALVNKLGQATPRVRMTEVMADARAGDGLRGTYKRKASYKAKPSSRAPAGRSRAAAGAAKPAGASAGRRGPPPGGLDLASMAAAWRAAGKPGSWQDWIRSNQIRRPR